MPKKQSKTRSDDPDKTLVDLKALAQLHNEKKSKTKKQQGSNFDKLVLEFVSERLMEGGKFFYKTGVFKKDKISRYCEVVIPINFNTVRFYRQPVDTYHFHQMQMHNQQMMMQQNMSHIKPPSFH